MSYHINMDEAKDVGTVAQDEITPYVDSRDKAIEFFNSRYADLSQLNTLDSFQLAREQVAAEVDPDGSSYIADFLYPYFGAEALPFIYPNIYRTHFAIDYAKKTAQITDPEALSQLPEFVGGVPVGDLLNSVASFMSDETAKWRKAHGLSSATRIDIATGRCFLAGPLVDKLKSLYPDMADKIHHLRIPLATKRGISPLYLNPLSDGHSIVGIEYVQEGKPMMLQIDPTVAQVDMNNKYDIEVTAMPKNNFQDILKLRYRTYPQVEIISH